MPGITSHALPSPTSTGRASIIRSVASVLAFSMLMVVSFELILLEYSPLRAVSFFQHVAYRSAISRWLDTLAVH